MYIAFTKLIKQANQNSSIKYIIISGSGANYSSGNDLNNFIDYGNPKGTL
jgi:enoyl-CoA hydratase/carnithine racemase